MARTGNGVARRSVPAPQSIPLKPKVPRSTRMMDAVTHATDTLENVITGLGTNKDKSTYTQFTFREMDQGQIELAYRGDWIAAKAVDIPAEDSTREWRSWQSDNADIEELEKLESDLQVQQKTFEALQRARLYGGAGLLMGVNQGTMDQPLDPSKVKQGDLQFLHVVSKWDVSAGPIDWDIASPYYGTPSYYTNARGGDPNLAQMQRIHPSRLVRFIGKTIPNRTLAASLWGDSILQAVADAILAAGTVTANGAQLLQEIKMDIIKIPELSKALSNKKYEERLLARFAAANLAKSLYNILLLDKEEEWERITANMQGIPDTLKMYLLIAAAANDIPATRFLSQSPAGLSATGESDIRNYYDKLKSVQNTVITPAMNVLDEVLIRSAVGDTKDGDVVYFWRPLWQMDDAQKAEIASKKATTWKTDVDANLIPAEVLRDARINQLIEDGTYPGLEQILDDYGPLEEVEEAEEEPVVLLGPNGEPLEPDPEAELAAANENRKPPNQRAVADMARRIRESYWKKEKGKRGKKRKLLKGTALHDATPRTLYVRRDLLNKDEVMAWAASVGLDTFGKLIDPAELHVTIMYSRQAVDWGKANEDWGTGPDAELVIKPGGMRMLDKLGVGGSVVALLFTSSELSWRHQSLKDRLECSWDWDYYQPHLTFVYDDENTPIDWEALRKVQAYQGELRFGPEIWAETTQGY